MKIIKSKNKCIIQFKNKNCTKNYLQNNKRTNLK